LAKYSDGGFECVVIERVPRIDPRAIVSVPNFGHWKMRLQIALDGQPVLPSRRS